jgi:hypothetical protein
METMPRKAVWAVAVVLVGLAAWGTYQGWKRSAVDEAGTAADGSLLPTVPAVAGARSATALVEPPAPALNEAQIREIARQEVRATLRGDAAASSESAPASGSTSSATAPTPTIGPAAAPGTRPAASAPAAPAPAAPPPAATPAPSPAPSQSSNAPLF